ncbi:hypothetical protein BJ138DRAFT_1160681 [Hygrophoropsis aurantiaca]|uniref:Uncharacterized protein n=1 Tax=Hygrophoropsis aurantiaca TaxID=72124 RepID=A0ACB8A2L6_9AGAM|nr:hypothetical protein BJ138DRAFT_1160681 [Hygrophoropsis aurantiaca]
MERERRAMERERDRDRDRAAPPPHERSPAANTRMVGPLATQDTYNASIPQNTLRANDVRTRPSPFFYGQAQPNANATPTAHAQPTPPNAHPSLHVNVHTNTNLNGHHNRVSPEPEFGYQPPPTPRAGWGNSPIRRRAETVSGATHINWSPAAAAGAGAEVARMFRRAGGGDVFLTDARVGDDDRVPDPSRGQHTLTENHMWDQLNDALWEAPQGGNDMVLG